jgi:hypothetical protein
VTRLKVTYELADDDAVMSEEYEIGEESWRVMPEIRQAVTRIAGAPAVTELRELRAQVQEAGAQALRDAAQAARAETLHGTADQWDWANWLERRAARAEPGDEAESRGRWSQAGLDGAQWKVVYPSQEAAAEAVAFLMRHGHGHHFAVVDEGTSVLMSTMATECLVTYQRDQAAEQGAGT